MSNQELSYKEAKERLDEMVVEIRRKDISLENSLDLLEEAVRLVNRCTELIDTADWDESDEGIEGENEDVLEETQLELEEVEVSQSDDGAQGEKPEFEIEVE